MNELDAYTRERDKLRAWWRRSPDTPSGWTSARMTS